MTEVLYPTVEPQATCATPSESAPFLESTSWGFPRGLLVPHTHLHPSADALPPPACYLSCNACWWHACSSPCQGLTASPPFLPSALSTVLKIHLLLGSLSGFVQRKHPYLPALPCSSSELSLYLPGLRDAFLAGWFSGISPDGLPMDKACLDGCPHSSFKLGIAHHLC